MKSSPRFAGVPLSSLTVTLANGTVPGFVTRYVHVTVEPGVNSGPASAVLAS
jgi:hypothetical protein